MKIDTAKADVSHAKAQLVAAKADARQAGRDAARMKTLLKEGTVEKHRSEEADLVWTAKRSELITAQEALKQTQKRLAETELGWVQINAMENEIKGYKAQVAQAEATLTEARSLLDNLTIHAPATGVVLCIYLMPLLLFISGVGEKTGRTVGALSGQLLRCKTANIFT